MAQLHELPTVTPPADLIVGINAAIDRPYGLHVRWNLFNTPPMRVDLAASVVLVVGLLGIQYLDPAPRDTAVKEAPAMAPSMGPVVSAPEAAPMTAPIDALMARPVAPPAVAPSVAHPAAPDLPADLFADLSDAVPASPVVRAAETVVMLEKAALGEDDGKAMADAMADAEVVMDQ